MPRVVFYNACSVCVNIDMHVTIALLDLSCVQLTNQITELQVALFHRHLAVGVYWCLQQISANSTPEKLFCARNNRFHAW